MILSEGREEGGEGGEGEQEKTFNVAEGKDNQNEQKRV